MGRSDVEGKCTDREAGKRQNYVTISVPFQKQFQPSPFKLVNFFGHSYISLIPPFRCFLMTLYNIGVSFFVFPPPGKLEEREAFQRKAPKLDTVTFQQLREKRRRSDCPHSGSHFQ